MPARPMDPAVRQARAEGIAFLRKVTGFHRSSSPCVGQMLDRQARIAAKLLIFLARPAGIEPAFPP
jgi:hypothetical protein